MRVLWLTFIPSPYRLDFFEELGKQCELTVLFERASSKTRKGNWDDFAFHGYEARILPGITVGGYDRFCPGVLKYLNRQFDHIVISNPTSPTGILAAAVLRMKGIPYMVESDGAFPTGRTRGIRMMLKRFVMKPAQMCFSTADYHDQYYIECGVRPENLRRYPFTSLSEKDLAVGVFLTQNDKASMRQQLQMPPSRIVLSVGRFTYENGYGKGFDLLMRLAAHDPQTSFFIVGDTPTEEFLQWKCCENLQNVHFVGYKHKEELAKYYIAADVFVLLTRGDTWGLVINEAMAHGLPVITTDKCIAGLELVRDGKNGYIVPVGDVEQMAVRIMEIIESPELCAAMGQNSLKTIQDYTIENMCRVHIDVFTWFQK